MSIDVRRPATRPASQKALAGLQNLALGLVLIVAPLMWLSDESAAYFDVIQIGGLLVGISALACFFLTLWAERRSRAFNIYVAQLRRLLLVASQANHRDDLPLTPLEERQLSTLVQETVADLAASGDVLKARELLDLAVKVPGLRSHSARRWEESKFRPGDSFL